MRKKQPMAGGVFVALGAVAGVIIGKTQGQPSAGLVIGVLIGAAIAVVIWRRTR